MGANFSESVFAGVGGLLAICLVSGASAAEAANQAAAEPLFDVAFGAALTGDYISRGATQSDHQAAFQPFAELDVKNLYVGYWGSNVSSGGVPDWENDLSIGFRPTIGPVSLDLGYVQYIYSNDLFADPSGEVYVKGSSTRPNRLRWAPKLYVNRAQTNATYSELHAAYALPHNIKLSGAVGLGYRRRSELRAMERRRVVESYRAGDA